MSVWDDDTLLPLGTLQACLAPRDGQAEEAVERPVQPVTVAGTLRQMCLDLGVIPFRAEDIGGLFVRYPARGRHEIDGLRSSRFKAWLAAKYFDDMQVEPKQADIEGALLLLAAIAEFSEPRKLHTRIGTVGGKIYLDLCNEERQAVEIDADGWRVVDEPPVWFLRSSMKALPVPQLGGSLMDLREFANASDEDFVLLVGWLLASMTPDIAYPILALSSEHGSGKTTLTNLLKSLIDPDGTGGIAPFKDADALCAAASSRHVVAVDNLSRISGEDSDYLCRVATGMGIVRRKLYTDGESYESYFRKPLILNGIAFAPDRADLLDRCYPISLLPLTTGRRRDRELQASFEKARPGILGAILTAMSVALREQDYNPAPAVRMIDAAAFVMRAEHAGALPWAPGTFERILLAKEQDKQVEAVTGTPIGRILLELAEEGPWEGYVKALFDQVKSKADDEERMTLPKSVRGFGAVLTRLTPMLRGLGVAVVREEPRREFGYWVRLSKTGENVTTGGRESSTLALHCAPEHPVHCLYIENPNVQEQNPCAGSVLSQSCTSCTSFLKLGGTGKEGADTPDSNLSEVSDISFFKIREKSGINVQDVQEFRRALWCQGFKSCTSSCTLHPQCTGCTGAH